MQSGCGAQKIMACPGMLSRNLLREISGIYISSNGTDMNPACGWGLEIMAKAAVKIVCTRVLIMEIHGHWSDREARIGEL